MDVREETTVVVNANAAPTTPAPAQAQEHAVARAEDAQRAANPRARTKGPVAPVHPPAGPPAVGVVPGLARTHTVPGGFGAENGAAMPSAPQPAQGAAGA